MPDEANVYWKIPAGAPFTLNVVLGTKSVFVIKSFRFIIEGFAQITDGVRTNIFVLEDTVKF